MDGIAGAVEDEFERVVRLFEVQVLRTACRMLGNWADAEDVRNRWSGSEGLLPSGDSGWPHSVFIGTGG